MEIFLEENNLNYMNKQVNDPKISIIMPIFNVERFIKEAIESILNQTFNDFEFIIINDGSTDNSFKIIKEYAKKDNRIIIINNSKNLGIIKSLNLGLKKAQGKYVARMDGDDISKPKRLEIQYNFLEKNKDIFLVGTGSEKINENSKIISIHNPIVSEKKIIKTLPKKNCFRHSSIMFRNEKNIFYREKMHFVEDYDLYLLLLSKNKRLLNLPFYLLKYRIRENSINIEKAGKQVLFNQRAKEFYKQRLKSTNDEYEYFNPKEILKINVNKSIDKLVLRSEIKVNFKLNNFERVRVFCKKYFKNHGYFNKMRVYYILSFFPKPFLNLIRIIVFGFLYKIYFKIILIIKQFLFKDLPQS